MDFNTLKAWEEVSETGVIYELGSIYARLLKLADLRKARGKHWGGQESLDSKTGSFKVVLLLSGFFNIRFRYMDLNKSW